VAASGVRFKEELIRGMDLAFLTFAQLELLVNLKSVRGILTPWWIAFLLTPQLQPLTHPMLSVRRLFSPLFLVFTAMALFTGCESMDPRLRRDTVYLGGFSARDDARGNFDNYSYWDGDGKSGPRNIVIRLSEQRAYFYIGGELAGVATISTGREGFGTPTGSFKIQQKDKNYASGKYGDYVDSQGRIIQKDIDRTKDPIPQGARFDGAKMPYFMRIKDGIGMHEGFLPGYAASHGCIRMPRFMAEAFFRHVEVGTPVVIEH
jgi:hypothetical protein